VLRLPAGTSITTSTLTARSALPSTVIIIFMASAYPVRTGAPRAMLRPGFRPPPRVLVGMDPRMNETVDRLLKRAGQTYAEQAGIRLTDRPDPLYRLLLLSVLLSTRITADLGVAATRELISSGMGTPRGMLDASWQDRVDALGRAHYKRYDESTATALGDGARLLLEEYDGDLRKLRDRADRQPATVKKLLTAFPRLGPVGANIFVREAQRVWPELAPAFDGKARDGARRVGLPTQPGKLAGLVPNERLADLAAALVRVALDSRLAEQIQMG